MQILIHLLLRSINHPLVLRSETGLPKGHERNCLLPQHLHNLDTDIKNAPDLPTVVVSTRIREPEKTATDGPGGMM